MTKNSLCPQNNNHTSQSHHQTTMTKTHPPLPPSPLTLSPTTAPPLAPLTNVEPLLLMTKSHLILIQLWKYHHWLVPHPSSQWQSFQWLHWSRQSSLHSLRTLFFLRQSCIKSISPPATVLSPLSLMALTNAILSRCLCGDWLSSESTRALQAQWTQR